MNILYISPTYFPLRGGTEQVIYELTSRLKSGNKIIIMTKQWEREMKPFEVINGIEIYRTRGINIKGFMLLTNYLSFFILGFKLHKKIKFDLIHLFHTYECGGAATLLRKIVLYIGELTETFGVT